MKSTSFVFFTLIACSFSASLRDIMIGEWDVFPADSDFSKTSYTIEFHQSSYDPLDINSLNCTLWKDESMHSYLPSSFIFNQQGPLIASLQIHFNSDYSGSIFNIRTRHFTQKLNTNAELNAEFSFDSTSEIDNKKISRFKIDRYTFVIDLSRLAKEGQLDVEVSSSIDNEDNSLISSKNRYTIIRAKEFENKYMTKQKQTTKNYESNLNHISNKPIETKISNKIKEFLDKMEIYVPDSYILFVLAILIMFIIYLVSKIVAACFFSSKTKKPVKAGTAKKAKKHKKKASSPENKKEESKSKEEDEEIRKTDENNEKLEDNQENSEKIKTD